MSADQEKQNQAQRWRELAELLGLPADEAPTPESKAPPVPPRPEPEEPMDSSWRFPNLSAEPLPPPEPEPEAAFTPAAEEVRPDPTHWPIADEDPLAEEEAVPLQDKSNPEEPRGDEEKPRGRRRGRRGRKDSKETRAEKPSSRQGGQPASGEEEDREARPRRRGPSRSKDTAEAEEALAGVDDALEEDVEVPTRTEEDEDDNLSDWTVPSWTELIASLYRPDR